MSIALWWASHTAKRRHSIWLGFFLWPRNVFIQLIAQLDYLCILIFWISVMIIIFLSEAAPAEGERRVGSSVRRSTTCGARRVGLGSQTHSLILRDFFNGTMGTAIWWQKEKEGAAELILSVFGGDQAEKGRLLADPFYSHNSLILLAHNFISISAAEGGWLTTWAGWGAPRIGSPEGARAVAKSYEWTGSPPRKFWPLVITVIIIKHIQRSYGGKMIFKKSRVTMLKCGHVEGTNVNCVSKSANMFITPAQHLTGRSAILQNKETIQNLNF